MATAGPCPSPQRWRGGQSLGSAFWGQGEGFMGQKPCHQAGIHRPPSPEGPSAAVSVGCRCHPAGHSPEGSGGAGQRAWGEDKAAAQVWARGAGRAWPKDPPSQQARDHSAPWTGPLLPKSGLWTSGTCATRDRGDAEPRPAQTHHSRTRSSQDLGDPKPQRRSPASHPGPRRPGMARHRPLPRAGGTFVLSSSGRRSPGTSLCSVPSKAILPEALGAVPEFHPLCRCVWAWATRV